MAKKTIPGRKATRKRSSMGDELMMQRQALQRTRRLEQQIRHLSRALRRDVARANSELCALAQMVFENDADFREAIVENETSTRTRDAIERRPSRCLCGHAFVEHIPGRECTKCSCEMFEIEGKEDAADGDRSADAGTDLAAAEAR